MSIPWGAWGGAQRELHFPAGWDVVELRMQDAPALTADEIEHALDRPIGTARLEELARARTRAAIAVDDITRPTRSAPIVAALVRRLESAGLRRDNISIVIATGAHRAATADDIRLKVGDAASQIRVASHDPVGDVVQTGVSLAGHAVSVNRHFLAADLRITVGGVMPHPFAGFSGGGKMVLPGLSDLDAVVRSHKYALMGFGGGLKLEGNRFRNDMERAVRDIGLDWTVNVVMNARCDPAALFAGDVVAAHRAAAARAREIGATAAPRTLLDALVLNAYPKDSELLQVEAALVAVRTGMLEWLRPGAPIVLVGACPDGLGSHRLFGPEGRLFRRPAAKAYLQNRPLHVVSEATAADLDRAVFWEGYPYHQSWESCLTPLAAALPPRAVVGYAANGPLHVADTQALAAGGADRKEGDVARVAG